MWRASGWCICRPIVRNSAIEQVGFGVSAPRTAFCALTDGHGIARLSKSEQATVRAAVVIAERSDMVRQQGVILEDRHRSPKLERCSPKEESRHDRLSSVGSVVDGQFVDRPSYGLSLPGVSIPEVVASLGSGALLAVALHLEAAWHREADHLGVVLRRGAAWHLEAGHLGVVLRLEAASLLEVLPAVVLHPEEAQLPAVAWVARCFAHWPYWPPAPTPPTVRTSSRSCPPSVKAKHRRTMPIEAVGCRQATSGLHRRFEISPLSP